MMGTTADKLNKLLETKAAIKQAIVSKGVEVGEDVVFADYPTKISAIEAGGGSSENNPYQQLYMQRTNNETNMIGMFSYTPATSTLDLSVINTSKVTEMTRMFDNCQAPYLDLSGFDVSNVIDMSYMFNNCWSNVNCENWDTSKVRSTSYMFSHFAGSIDLSKLDFSSANAVSYMFDYAKINNINLTGLSFPNATSFGYLFNYAEGDLLELSSWDISNITNMTYMFNNVNIKKIDLTGWKTTNVTNMNYIFTSYGNNLVELIIPDWDMTNAIEYKDFFKSGSNYHKGLMLIDLSRSNDITITKIASTLPTRTTTTFGKVMIPSESSQDAINALITKYWKPVGPRIDMTSCEIVTELDEVKPGKSTKLYYNPEPWYANDVNIEYVSSDESVATIDKETMTITSTGIEGTTEITARTIDTQEVISVTPITLAVSETDNYPNVIKFRGTSTPGGSNYIYVNGMSTNNRAYLNTMNYNSASGIYTYDVGAPITYVKFNGPGNATYSNTCTEVIKINISNMTSMENMFYYCDKITSLDLSNCDTSKVTTMQSMFAACHSLTSLDLSSFNTSQVTTMQSMFSNCKSLTSLNLSNFDTSKVTIMASMFQGCDKLHTLRLDNCNDDTVRKIITSSGFPTGDIGATRNIYVSRSLDSSIQPPSGWVFALVD